MNITINGKITAVLPKKTGVSKTGNEWASQDFVIETDNNEKICFNVFGEETIQKSGLALGATASVTCKIESKEWNGRWFTSVSCINCIVQGNIQPTQQQVSQPRPQVQALPVQRTSSSTDVDSLPF